MISPAWSHFFTSIAYGQQNRYVRFSIYSDWFTLIYKLIYKRSCLYIKCMNWYINQYINHYCINECKRGLREVKSPLLKWSAFGQDEKSYLINVTDSNLAVLKKIGSMTEIFLNMFPNIKNSSFSEHLWRTTLFLIYQFFCKSNSFIIFPRIWW